jgi:hypothetical protein
MRAQSVGRSSELSELLLSSWTRDAVLERVAAVEHDYWDPGGEQPIGVPETARVATRYRGGGDTAQRA